MDPSGNEGRALIPPLPGPWSRRDWVRRSSAGRRQGAVRGHLTFRPPSVCVARLSSLRALNDPWPDGIDHDNRALSCANAVRILPRPVHQWR